MRNKFLELEIDNMIWHGCVLCTQILCSYHVTGLQNAPIRGLLKESIMSHLAKVNEENEIHDFLAQICMSTLKFACEP